MLRNDSGNQERIEIAESGEHGWVERCEGVLLEIQGLLAKGKSFRSTVVCLQILECFEIRERI